MARAPGEAQAQHRDQAGRADAGQADAQAQRPGRPRQRRPATVRAAGEPRADGLSPRLAPASDEADAERARADDQQRIHGTDARGLVDAQDGRTRRTRIGTDHPVQDQQARRDRQPACHGQRPPGAAPAGPRAGIQRTDLGIERVGGGGQQADHHRHHRELHVHGDDRAQVGGDADAEIARAHRRQVAAVAAQPRQRDRVAARQQRLRAIDAEHADQAREHRADVAAAGDGGQVIEALEDAALRQATQQAEAERRAADAAAGQCQADERRAPVLIGVVIGRAGGAVARTSRAQRRLLGIGHAAGMRALRGGRVGGRVVERLHGSLLSR